MRLRHRNVIRLIDTDPIHRAVHEASNAIHRQQQTWFANTKPFVRYVEGSFVLTWNDGSGFHHRPLTLNERILWRLAQRTPKP